MADPFSAAAWFLAIPGAVQATLQLCEAARTGREPDAALIDRARLLPELLAQLNGAVRWVRAADVASAWFDGACTALARLTGGAAELLRHPPDASTGGHWTGWRRWRLAHAELAQLTGQTAGLTLPEIVVSDGQAVRFNDFEWRREIAKRQQAVDAAVTRAV